MEFWVGVTPGSYLQLDDVVVTERPLPGGPTVRLSGLVAQVKAVHEGARFGSDVFLIADGVLPAATFEAAQVLTTRVDPEVYVPPEPGRQARRAVGAERDQALAFDSMAGQAAHRPRARRFAALRRLRVRRRHARCPRQHLGHLGGGHQDELRHLPAAQRVHVGRAGGRSGQHQGPGVQREGRGPAVPRPAQHRAHRRPPVALRRPRPARRPLRLGGGVRAAPARRPHGGARRGQPHHRRAVVLLDPGRVLRRRAAAVRVRRRRGRAPAVHDGRPQRHRSSQDATASPSAPTGCGRSRASPCAPTPTWSTWSWSGSATPTTTSGRGSASAWAPATPSSAACCRRRPAWPASSGRTSAGGASTASPRRRPRSPWSTSTTCTTGPSASWSASP